MEGRCSVPLSFSTGCRCHLRHDAVTNCRKPCLGPLARKAAYADSFSGLDGSELQHAAWWKFHETRWAHRLESAEHRPGSSFHLFFRVLAHVTVFLVCVEFIPSVRKGFEGLIVTGLRRFWGFSGYGKAREIHVQ